MKQRALISVSDKTGIIELAQGLIELGIEIVSTGGTREVLETAGIHTLDIQTVTGFPEMLDGRVKTLHPAVHGGLLARRDVAEHLEQLNQQAITPIDFVFVNLYPFKATLKNSEATAETIIENIDIGGPSMLRSGAKNFSSVTVVVDPKDYSPILNQLKNYQQTDLITRKRLAAKVFRHTAAYDSLIASYLTNEVQEEKTENLTMTFELKQNLRYGENAQQQASFYSAPFGTEYSMACAKQLHGKALSFNNIRDTDAGLRLIREFNRPTVVAIKHMNPCGVGSGDSILEAYKKAYAADPISIFGGIVLLNRPVDLAVANELHQLFVEIIIAPGFEPAALEILSKKKNLRLLTLDFSKGEILDKVEFTSVLGGILVQSIDANTELPEEWSVVTEKVPTVEQIKALDFAWKVSKHVKSNAIVVANENQTLGIGAGQMNRVGSVEIALNQSATLENAVVASDAFFPMADSVELIAKAGVKAIIQPGGSIRDQESIDACNQAGITMVFTDVRHFRH